MLTVAKFYLLILLFGSIAFFLNTKNKKADEKLRISKTLIPLEYTGKDYDDWKRSIIIERQILSIKNETDIRLNLKLTKNLLQENIFIITNK